MTIGSLETVAMLGKEGIVSVDKENLVTDDNVELDEMRLNCKRNESR